MGTSCVCFAHTTEHRTQLILQVESSPANLLCHSPNTFRQVTSGTQRTRSPALGATKGTATAPPPRFAPPRALCRKFARGPTRETFSYYHALSQNCKPLALSDSDPLSSTQADGAAKGVTGAQGRCVLPRTQLH